ncbi:MAG: DUF4157 domain-containing protein [Armatimonadetes bacterium]|nr:DUF4157 domain-containing protein [Armatimonadota bacterium]
MLRARAPKQPCNTRTQFATLPSRAAQDIAAAPQAVCDFHDFSKAPIFPVAPPAAQPGLRVSQPEDSEEREARSLADIVLHTPLSADTTPRAPAASSSVTQPPPAVRRPGRFLDTNVRAEMEGRFGHDFAHVRIHTGGEAEESARRLRARAYTLGSHIVFGAGQYAPGSGSGRGLLAHELAHVMQQDGGRGRGVVMRAEVDDRSCAGLTDIETDIDAKVNSEIAAARTAAGSPMSVPTFLKDVRDRLGKGAVTPMEDFIEAMPTSKRNLPGSNLSSTKYSGVSAVNRFYDLQTLGLAHVVGSAAKAHGICIGADKLGHFFGEGFIYFQVASAPGLTTADAQSTGRALEIGIQGLGTTGVFSNADQAANLAGMQFYKDLEADPAGFKFAIKNYISNRWNEQSNPSFYESSVGGIVWSNLLTGNWNGTFTTGGPLMVGGISSIPMPAKVSLFVTPAGAVTGTYEWPAGAAKPFKGKIKNGKITQKTTSVSGTIPGQPSVSATPVIGIAIEFDWELGKATGKGQWDSVDEQTLTGTWGNGASRTNGGAWNQKKV